MDGRKESILEAIVREYVGSGQPVGSLALVEKYQFPFSTATIRAEMAELERLGFLSHPHTSAGRIPTEKGYRYFVKMMSEEEALLGRRTDVARKRLLPFKGQPERELDVASEVLSEFTRNMGFAGFPGEIFSHGLSYLFSQQEFLDPIRMLKTAEMIDNLDNLFSEIPRGLGTRVFVGSESPIGKASGCSIVISEFSSPYGRTGYLGVLGPMRMAYGHNLSAVKEIKNILEEKNG